MAVGLRQIPIGFLAYNEIDTKVLEVNFNMKSNIITLHVPSSIDREEYVLRLHELSNKLQQIAAMFHKDPRVALADLTYLVVSNDIMSTIHVADSHVGPMQIKESIGVDTYVLELGELSVQLQQVAELAGDGARSVLADLTYIAVCDDIMSTVESMEGIE